MASPENRFDDTYDGYREWLLGLKHYPEKPLNSRLRCLVDAIPAGSKVLDVACGTGRVLQAAIAKGCQGRGIEISAPAVETACQKGLDVIEGDVDSWPDNPQVSDLLFGDYDIVVFSKCLMYLGTKNEILGRLKAKSILIFQSNPNSIRNRFNGETANLMKWNKQLPYRLKDGTEIEQKSAASLAAWAASYGFRHSKIVYGGLWARSLIMQVSR
ncbi:MAG: methyltransferase [Verrucomicrobiaceae bacterium]|nr:MAG: methyltransferase [Verrucomicrobiaceae bacterium]